MVRIMLENYCNRCLHAVRLCNSPDVMSSGDRTGNGCLLLVIGEAFACKIGTPPLRNLKDDR
jgi:hypothetical protein